MKAGFEFWAYRDVRKERFPPPKIIEVPDIGSKPTKEVEILLSHHYLIPLAETPQIIVNSFKSQLTFRNPEFLDYKKYGKGFIPKHIDEFVRMYVIDSTYMGIPRSVNVNEIERAYNKQGIAVRIKDIRPEFKKIEFKRKEGIEQMFYQKDVIDYIVNRNVVIQLFCGRGKTTSALLAISQVRMRTLILVRTKLLMKQWLEEIHKIFDIQNDDIGLIYGDVKTEGKITIATVQSICAMSREQQRRIGSTYGHVIGDEIHEGGSKNFRKLLQVFKCRKITGLSATPHRQDGCSRFLVAYIGEIIQVDDSGIIPVKFDLVRTEFEYTRGDGRTNEYTQMVDALIHDEKRNQLIVDKLVQYADEGESIFVFSSRIAHLETIQSMFSKLRPEINTGMIVAQTSDGKIVPLERQEAIRNGMENKDIRIVFGTQIIKQGFNVRPLSVCVLATPQKSNILIEQILGREQREYKGKDEVVFVDFIDEKVDTLLHQFFYKNKKIYRRYREMSEKAHG